MGTLKAYREWSAIFRSIARNWDYKVLFENMLDVILIAQLARTPDLSTVSIEPVVVDYQQQSLGNQHASRAEYLKKQQEALNQSQKDLAIENKEFRKRLPPSTLQCHPAYGGFSPEGLFSTCPNR
ncbi:hypothetical protein [Altericista sp. CCNU0014]|uniref:hypothetical protein n=1 Tax=Altericista sp. CCNU0014 TaxID=3082949 RepID=UPI00384F77FF